MRQVLRLYAGDVSTVSQRPRRSRAARLATGLAAAGGIGICASMLIAFLIADHSSSDSSASSVIAMALGSIGVVLVVLGCGVFTALALSWLWHRAGRLSHRGSGTRPAP
jgi:UDP-N-acetylmuramyl pentapeptide phosphotransferase/UDP-N-acetylglucosamine-1-phosphate transferase